MCENSSATDLEHLVQICQLEQSMIHYLCQTLIIMNLQMTMLNVKTKSTNCIVEAPRVTGFLA
jgi:hypothetical protein